ncbi:MAG: hypothetical protein R3F31_15370 [Verrucomicrobiales bacterium]
MPADKVEEKFFWQAVIISRASNFFQGYLGRSTNFGDPVSALIAQRVRSHHFYGVLTFLITYGLFPWAFSKRSATAPCSIP